MGKWEIAKLDEICSLITDGTHQTPEYCNAHEGYPFLSSKDVTTEVINWDYIKYIPKPLHEQLYKRLAPQVNDILLAKNGTTGVAALVDRNCIFDIYVSLALLRPSEVIYPPYLLRVINSPLARSQFSAHLKGIGVPNLHLSEIRNTKIPLPPLDVQQQIADVLDHASSLIEKRKAQIERLDSLIKSQFIEMFGDLGSNPYKYKWLSLGECCEINPKRTKETRLTDDLEVSFVAMQSVSERGVVDSTEIRPYVEVKKGFTYFVENDVLFAKITPCMENGKGGIAQNLSNGIGFGSTEFHVLRSIPYCSNPYWIYYLTTFKNFRAEAEQIMTGSAGQRRVPVTFLENYMVALPTIELQNQFEEFVRQVDKYKFVLQQSLSRLQLNYNSLMQKCFRGEIF